jgi:MFS family permease
MMAAQARAGTQTTYGRLFRVPGFAQLAAGTVLARTAGNFWQIALVLFVLTEFHSPPLAGLATLLSILPGLMVSPVAGALLDRHGRLRLILLDYGVATVTLTLLGALAFSHLLTPWLMLAIVTVGSLTGPLSASGTRSLFPMVVPRTFWDRANAIDSGSMALASVVGPALAGFVVAFMGGAGAFFITALLFALSAAVLFGFDEPVGDPGAPTPLMRSAWQALCYVLQHPTLRAIAVTFELVNIGYGIVTVALPVLVLQRFHWGTGAVGILWSLSGVATVAAGLAFGRINTEGRERRIVAVGMAITAVGCVALTAAPFALALVVAMVLMGLSAAPIDIGVFGLRQRRTDPAWFGRAFAVSMSLNFSGMPLGAALAGPLVVRSIPLALGLAVVFSLLGAVAALRLIPKEPHLLPPSFAREGERDQTDLPSPALAGDGKTA